ncbi:MAG: hypothetical protein LBT89_01425 [Planctomycetaceae bacterium]|jgi:hypothetical protein|nr:hypothetical protein [Planctomycetaceae bacterium]
MKHFPFFGFVFFLLVSPLLAQDLPPLAGDGAADDTAAIQARLDSGAKCVYLPEPKKHYVISQALKIHSDQTLRLDPNTLIYRADNTNASMLVNADIVNGNKNISVIGGVWDGNNRSNKVRYLTEKNGGAIAHSGDIFMGNSMLFLRVENLRIEHITLKDPVLFGMHLGGCHRFTINDIVFDYNLKNPSMDGIHLNGMNSQGRITNIKGDTNDDMVALNADDVPFFNQTPGPITDIEIDGLWGGEKCFRGVRMLSTGSPVKRISISNVYGQFYRNAVAFTHYKLPFHNTPAYEDIDIRNIFCSKLTEPDRAGKSHREGERKGFAVIGIEGEMSIDNLNISNVHRREYLPGAAPTLHIRRGTKITSLRLRDIEQINKTDVPLPLFRNEASIMKLFIDGTVVREKNGKVLPLVGNGSIVKQYGEFLTETDEDLRRESDRLDEELKTKPANKDIL